MMERDGGKDGLVWEILGCGGVGIGEMIGDLFGIGVRGFGREDLDTRIWWFWREEVIWERMLRREKEGFWSERRFGFEFFEVILSYLKRG